MTEEKTKKYKRYYVYAYDAKETARCALEALQKEVDKNDCSPELKIAVEYFTRGYYQAAEKYSYHIEIEDQEPINTNPENDIIPLWWSITSGKDFNLDPKLEQHFVDIMIEVYQKSLHNIDGEVGTDPIYEDRW